MRLWYLLALASGLTPNPAKPAADAAPVTKRRRGNENEGCDLFIKHSSKRRSPWRYTFTLAHQEEVQRLYEGNEDVFVILIAGEDG